MNIKGKKLPAGLVLSILYLTTSLNTAGASTLNQQHVEALMSSKAAHKHKHRGTCDTYPRHQLLNKASRYHEHILAAAQEHRVSPHLITAVITVESCFRPKAKSSAGAAGLMQLMPATARRFGLTNRYDVAGNINAGTKYLKFLLKRFEGNVQLAAAAYNAGEGAVDKYSGVPPYKQTHIYVSRVLNVYRKLAKTQTPQKHQSASRRNTAVQPQRTRAWYIQRYERDRLFRGLKLTAGETEHLDQLLKPQQSKSLPVLSFEQFL